MRQEKNNKGFSLVELIVVVAIMIVLVAVLAPVFTKHIERSRRATDVQNANTIANTILVEVAEDPEFDASADVAIVEETDSLKKVPDVKGKTVDNAVFYYKYVADENRVEVYVGTDAKKSEDLTNEAAATAYTNATKGNLGNEKKAD